MKTNPRVRLNNTVAHASGSERYVFFPSLILILLISVFFRVRPWQILLLILLLPSEANDFATLKSGPFRAFILIKIGGMGEMFCFFYWHPLFI